MFEYIFEGPPNMVAGLQPALGLDKVDNVLYVWSSSLCQWVQIGNSTGINDSVQNLTTSQTIALTGATNTFVKATGGSAGITLELPSAVSLSGRKITIMKVDTDVGAILVEGQPAQGINGLSTYEISNTYQSITVESDNSNWFIVASAG